MSTDDQAPRPNRPTPRTAAALESDLRRQLRAALQQARDDAGGELADKDLAAVIASAIAAAFAWHLEAPEHARGMDRIGSGTWRPADGPRGRPRPQADWEGEGEPGPRRPPRRDFGGPDSSGGYGRGPAPEWRPRQGGGFRNRDRDEGFQGGPGFGPGPRPRGGFGGGGFSGGAPRGGFGGGPRRPFPGGGFGPRKPGPRGGR